MGIGIIIGAGGGGCGGWGGGGGIITGAGGGGAGGWGAGTEHPPPPPPLTTGGAGGHGGIITGGGGGGAGGGRGIGIIPPAKKKRSCFSDYIYFQVYRHHNMVLSSLKKFEETYQYYYAIVSVANSTSFLLKTVSSFLYMVIFSFINSATTNILISFGQIIQQSSIIEHRFATN